MTTSEVTIDGTIVGDRAADAEREGDASPSSFEKIKSSARDMGEKVKSSARDMGGKIKSSAVDMGEKATVVAKEAADNESLIQTGMAVSLGATVLTSIRGLNLRQYHAYAGTALVGFTLLHLLQNKRRRDKRAARK